jgi:hypothetical protein
MRFIVGDRLEHRAAGKFQCHVALEVQVLFDRVHHVDAVRHEHRASRARHRVDRGLNCRRVVGTAVAHGTLVLDVDDNVRSGRGRAILRRARARLHRQESERKRDCAGQEF